MPHSTNLEVRDARDQIIDLLGIGETYPLRDLPVRDERLTVPFDTTAKIPVEISQPDVQYLLHDREERPVKRAGKTVEVAGNGDTVILETPEVRDDVTYQILARKQETSREAYLHQTATAKVGLDTGLKVWIRNAPALDASIEKPDYTDPRIVDFGDTIEVEIEQSQEGVDYELVFVDGDGNEIALTEGQVRGDLSNIVLHSKPTYEDLEIRIRATKTFDASENRETQTALMDEALPLRVRANPALPVSLAASPVIDYQAAATVIISNTQESASYQLYSREIPDRHFVHDPASESEVLRVAAPGEPVVQVRRPSQFQSGQAPQGYAPLGAPRPGTGGDRKIEIPKLQEDSLFIVHALKQHRASTMIPSSVQLQQPVVVLVRPNPAPGLRLRVPIKVTQSDGTMEVWDGQAGVFYFFRRAPQGKEFASAAYFHQRDDRDIVLNKGVDELGVGIDFVIPADPPPGKLPSEEDRTWVAPENPRLETPALKADGALYVRALKAQTQIAIPLDQTAELPPLPEVGLEEPVVDFNTPARILVSSSKQGDRYELKRAERPRSEPATEMEKIWFSLLIPYRKTRSSNSASRVLTSRGSRSTAS